MSTPESVLTFDEFMACERISARTLFRRLEAGHYARCKTGRRLANGKREFGIPVWCLNQRGQRRWIRQAPKADRPARKKFLEMTTDGVRSAA